MTQRWPWMRRCADRCHRGADARPDLPARGRLHRLLFLTLHAVSTRFVVGCPANLRVQGCIQASTIMKLATVLAAVPSREARARPLRKVLKVATAALLSHRPAGLPARSLRAARPRPAPSRTSRRKPRPVSSTSHVPPTSDFRTGSRCALVFRDLPFTDPTTRRNSASPARSP